MTVPMFERAGLDARSWEDLFDFLDPGRAANPGPDRDARAEVRYSEIARKLACFFAGRGCPEADDLAEETVLRVAAKCRDIDVSGHADRAGYFYGVARNVLHEWLRRSLREAAHRESLRQELTRLPGPDRSSWATREEIHRGLDRCMAELTGRARRLIVAYYNSDEASAASRRTLADEFGKSANALRIEVHRIRKVLRDCVAKHRRRSGHVEIERRQADACLGAPGTGVVPPGERGAHGIDRGAGPRRAAHD